MRISKQKHAKRGKPIKVVAICFSPCRCFKAPKFKKHKMGR